MAKETEIIENETLEQKVERLERALHFANQKLAFFELNGISKLYFSLNRKMNEMATLLNNNDLTKMDIDDSQGKGFDRLFKLLEKSNVIANASQLVKSIANIQDDEIDSNTKLKFRITPESVADNIGGSAGQNS